MLEYNIKIETWQDTEIEFVRNSNFGFVEYSDWIKKKMEVEMFHL